jgi:hypothetical protein
MTMMTRTVALVSAMVAPTAACVGSGEVPAQVSGQIVGDDERPIGPGLIMVEKGKVHEGSYQTGAIIGEDGRFTVVLSEGGTWGLHLFYDETYTYLPVEIEIEDHQQIVLQSTQINWGSWMDLTGQPTWPDQPADANLVRMPLDDNLDDNPVLESVTMAYRGAELMDITLEVNDPDQDMSRMILAFDPATRNAFALSPPGPPDERGNFPNGTYMLTVFVEDVHVPGESEWHFILSDNLCNNTPVVIATMPAR